MDGLPAEVYQAFPEIFIPKLYQAMVLFLRRGGVPEEWATSLMKCLPKFAGAECPKDLRPLALQNTCVKWISTTIMLQVMDALQQIIPPEQKGFLPGRQMVDHLVFARAEWDRLPEQAMVAIDFQKAYDSVSFALMECTLLFLGLGVEYVRLLLSVMSAPILFCVGRSFEPTVVLHPRSGIRQGDPLSPLLFDVITVLLIYDIKSLKIELVLLLYADDILLCVPGRGSKQEKDLRAALYRLGIFGYFSGLKVNASKTYAVVKVREGEASPSTLAGVVVKPHVKYLGSLLGNVSEEKAYAPAIAKMMARARAMAALPLGLMEKSVLFASWVAPVCYLTARAYRPTEHVCSQLDLVHRTALGLTNWNLTMPILLLPPSEGGLGQASLSAYAQWAHSHSFVTYVLRPGRFAEQHSGPFRRWAAAQGLLMEEEVLPYLQLGPVPLSRPSFLQGCLKAYSVTRRSGGGVPPPPEHRLGHMPVWHNAQ